MNILFRLFFLYISLGRVVRRPLNNVGKLYYRVWPTDSDFLMHHMTNSRFASFADLGRLHWLAQSGLFDVMRDNKWVAVVAANQTLYIRMLRVFAKFELKTELVYWDENYLYLQHSYSVKDKKYAALVTKIAFLALKEEKKIPFATVIEKLKATTQDNDIQKPICPPSISDWQVTLKHRY